MTERDCDVVIIGSGPAGATSSDVLTGAGRSVIMLEKGRNHLLALDAPFAPLGHVSNDELKFMFRYFLGPDPFLEPRTNPAAHRPGCFHESDACRIGLSLRPQNPVASFAGGFKGE